MQSGYAAQGWVSRREEFCSSVIPYSHLFFRSVPHYSLPLLTSPLSGGREAFMRCREIFAPLWEFLSSPTSCHRLRFPIAFFTRGWIGEMPWIGHSLLVRVQYCMNLDILHTAWATFPDTPGKQGQKIGALVTVRLIFAVSMSLLITFSNLAKCQGVKSYTVRFTLLAYIPWPSHMGWDSNPNGNFAL